MKYNWKFKLNNNPLQIRAFEKEGITPLLAQIMINRHFSVKDYETIRNNFWSLVLDYCDNIVDLNSAAKFMTKALFDEKAIIYIFSDYDTDGVTSLMIAVEAFRTIQKWRFKGKQPDNIRYYIPNREEGYGLNGAFCDRVIREKNDDNGKHNFYVITFDNGITKKNEIRYLRNNEINTLVTDHHEPEGELPGGTIVDPKKDLLRKGDELCGAGIAWLLFVRMYYNFGLDNDIVPNDEQKAVMNSFLGPAIQKTLGYAAVGTIGDIMPMTLLNIGIVYNGLEYLNDAKRKDKNPIDLLKNMLDIKEITGKDISFGISAVINACGQMNKVETIVDFVMANDLEDMKKNLVKVEELYEKNKQVTKKMKTELDKRIKKGEFDKHMFCLVRIDPESDIPSGIAGKLASHIVSETNKPAIVFFGNKKNTQFKGSGRCPNNGINMLELLQEHKKDNLIQQANGHALACGVTIQNTCIDELQEVLDKELVKKEQTGLFTGEIEQDINIDARITLDDINFDTYRIINLLPYSNNFEIPTFIVTADIRNVKRSKNNPNNVCYEVYDPVSGKDMKIWAWNKKPNDYDETKHSEVTFVGNICRNFMYNKTLTIDVIDLKFN